MKGKILIAFLLLSMVSGYFPTALAEETPEEAPGFSQKDLRVMTYERLETLIRKIDPEFSGRPGHWQLLINAVPVRVISDADADRLRIISPVRNAEALNQDDIYRILQANYDSTLDARYALGQGVLWATFVHPLSSLTDRDFISGLAQTVNIVLTYGSTYSSGVMTFGGGDSGEIIERQLIEELMRRGDLI